LPFRHRAILPCVKTIPPRLLEGIIKSVSGRPDDWDLVVFLAPWREEDADVIAMPMRLVVRVGEGQAMERAMAEWQPGDAIAVAVTELEKEDGFSWWSAWGRGPIRSTDRAPFEAEIERLAKPRTFDDKTLGRLELDRETGWYECARRFGRDFLEVAVSTEDPDDDKEVARAIPAAAARVLAVEREWPALRDAIADELLDTCNEEWRDGRKPVSATWFKKQLSPTSVVVEQGRTTVYISSGSLFGEHGVEVRIPHRGKRREICIS
jgi:hypothetical protein